MSPPLHWETRRKEGLAEGVGHPSHHRVEGGEGGVGEGGCPSLQGKLGVKLFQEGKVGVEKREEYPPLHRGFGVVKQFREGVESWVVEKEYEGGKCRGSLQGPPH